MSCLRILSNLLLSIRELTHYLAMLWSAWSRLKNTLPAHLTCSGAGKIPCPTWPVFIASRRWRNIWRLFWFWRKQSLRRLHDLVALLESCAQFQPETTLLREPVELLNPYSVRFRYPGEESSTDEARQAIKATKMIVESLWVYFPGELLSGLESWVCRWCACSTHHGNE